MTDERYALLDDRGVLALAGADTLGFLQGVVTNDVMPAQAGRAVYAALLTPQGRFLHDFVIVPAGERFLVDCERARMDDLKRRLTMYRLRAKVTIDDVTESLAIFALFGAGAAAKAGLGESAGTTGAFAAGVACVDPRLATLGVRAVLPRATGAAALEAAGFVQAPRAAHERHRRALGVAEGSEIGTDKTLALEAGLDALNGVSFAKGCYVGQEVTSRMKNRGLVKKRIVPVAIEGPAPAPGTAVRLGEVEAGELRAAGDGVGLALLRLESLAQSAKGGVLTAGESRLTPREAPWLQLSEAAK